MHAQALFRRGQLKAFVDIHSETDGLGGGYLSAEEINIIRGALDMTEKKAFVGMTPLDKACTSSLCLPLISLCMCSLRMLALSLRASIYFTPIQWPALDGR